MGPVLEITIWPASFFFIIKIQIEVNTKYTTDGKKVAIVGKLNNTETIVQEIFVSENGSEIPAGENFVVKSLLDAPAKSWKESQIENIEKQYNSAKANLEKATEDLQKKTREMSEYTRAKMQWMKGIADNITKDWFELVYGFVAGEYTHFICCSYHDWRIVPFDDYMKANEYGGIRAFGIYTSYSDKKPGPIFKVARYSDGSGNGWDTVACCRSYEDALSQSKNLIAAEDHLSERVIDFAKKYKIEIPEGKMAAFLEAKEAARVKKISELEKEIEKLKA